MQRFALKPFRHSRVGVALFLLLLLLGCLTLVLQQPPALPQLQQLTINAWCDAGQIHTLPADFNAAGCQQASAEPADPQGRLLWLQLPFTMPESAAEKPLALFIFAKAASAVYLNGQRIGLNGQPGPAASEMPGYMDSQVYLPPALLRPGANQLVLQMSAQRGWFRLAQPIHFIGIGPYGDVRTYLQQHAELGLFLLGVL